ncbi:MAG TPA: efflux RND transporter periplasmic adaptor subunit [Gemmatimonadaceae bacterium]|nr:efflux RND transporter periplasmic adaptor subunit [Gemmatimonadaceae bacterium]
MVRQTINGLGLALIVVAVAACNQSGEAASANGSDGESKGEAGAPGGTREGGAGGAGGGRIGGRGMMAVVLGPDDVAEVKLGTIESATAIQGDLKPIEEVAVRARIEGDLIEVHVREGDRVRRGQVLARLEDVRETNAHRSAQADVAAAKADVTNAQWNADQSAELLKAGAIPEMELRAAQQTLAAAQARLAAAEARLSSTSQELNDTRVTAPTTGTISTRSIEAGEHVARGAALFTVVRNDVLELEASVPARFAGDVRPSMPVRFSAGGRELTGRVARVSPTINPANRSVTVYLQVPNPGGQLKGNTFATGRIVASTLSDVIVIPTTAIRYVQGQSDPFVYRIVNDVVEHQPVQLGVVDEATGIAQVTEGLQEGDRIIAGNVGAVGRGVRVRFAGANEGAPPRQVPRP